MPLLDAHEAVEVLGRVLPPGEEAQEALRVLAEVVDTAEPVVIVQASDPGLVERMGRLRRALDGEF